MDEHKTLKLSGVLKKVLYFNEENSYCIAVLENDQKICGTYVDAKIEKFIGEEIILTGNWITHKKYGTQFSFETLEIKEAELFFFLTKIVKGIGAVTAKVLLDKYGEEKLIKILNETPDVLLSIKGITAKKLQTIVKSWKKFQHLRELGTFLAQYNVSSNLITKIYQSFPEVENLIEKIKNNPYILINIRGIGFKRADEIARALGMNPESQFRIMACMNYTLRDYCDNNGNSSVEKTHLFSLLDDSLFFHDKDDLYELAINKMLADEDIHQTSINRFSPSILYNAEKRILEFFKRRENDKALKKIVSNFKTYIKKKEITLGFKLSDEQKEAVELINDGFKTIFLIGYAGTGKSTSARALLELLEEMFSYDDIITIALSGIASQRISDTTGYNSCTIQSLLMKNKDKDFFEQKVILLDEASMVNSVMFYQIISKIADDTIFIIVGDDGQLPAIGAGNVLGDSIKYELAPICKLTKIYRQNEDQAIAVIANDIRQGKVPDYKGTYEDFSFIPVSIDNYYAAKNSYSANDFSSLRADNTSLILKNIINISISYIEEFYKYIKEKNISKALTLYQIITPMKGGVLGTENLNKELQKIFNFSKEKSYKSRTYEYKLSDKVIHIKNENMKAQSMTMYKAKSGDFLQKRVFNGQLGLIIKLDFENDYCIILYPNDDMVVFYRFDELDNLLSLAYCLTIHKTQGMEYDNSLIPMTFSHYIMHNTKLLYTAITRAKKMCYIVGEEDAFINACKRIESTKRESVINDILSLQHKNKTFLL